MHLGSDLQNILRQSYDYLTIMPKFLLTYDKCLIYKISYDYRKINLRHNCAKSYDKQRAVLRQYIIIITLTFCFIVVIVYNGVELYIQWA